MAGLAGFVQHQTWGRVDLGSAAGGEARPGLGCLSGVPQAGEPPDRQWAKVPEARQEGPGYWGQEIKPPKEGRARRRRPE